MSPLPAAPRFFVDESALGLGLTLARARTDVVHPGHRLVPEIVTRMTDLEWMPLVAARNLIVICRDKRIRTRPAEVAAFRELGLRAFWIAGKRDMSTWDNVTLLARHWPRIEQILTEEGPGPWFMAMWEKDIKPLNVW